MNSLKFMLGTVSCMRRNTCKWHQSSIFKQYDYYVQSNVRRKGKTMYQQMYTVLNTKCYCMIRHFICNITQDLNCIHVECRYHILCLSPDFILCNYIGFSITWMPTWRDVAEKYTKVTRDFQQQLHLQEQLPHGSLQLNLITNAIRKCFNNQIANNSLCLLDSQLLVCLCRIATSCILLVYTFTCGSKVNLLYYSYILTLLSDFNLQSLHSV